MRISSDCGRVFGIWCVCTAVLAATAAAHEIIAKDLQIVHPYTTEPGEPAQTTTPVYMVIRNTGAQADRLLSARSPFAKTVSIVGKTPAGAIAIVDGGIDLPAHSETVVGPSTRFLRLDGLTEALQGYQYVPITFVFENAGTVEGEIYVEDATDQPAPQAKTN